MPNPIATSWYERSSHGRSGVTELLSDEDWPLSGISLVSRSTIARTA